MHDTIAQRVLTCSRRRAKFEIRVGCKSCNCSTPYPDNYGGRDEGFNDVINARIYPEKKRTQVE